jgi:hypothetical protein
MFKVISKASILVCFFIFVISVFSWGAQASEYTKMTACHDCEDYQYKLAAKQQFSENQSGNVYVIDFPSQKYVKYRVYIDWVDVGEKQTPVQKTKLLPLSDAQSTALQDLFRLVEALKNEMSVSNEDYSFIVQSKSFATPEGFMKLGTIDILDSIYAENIYDFLRTLKIRNDLFQLHLAGTTNKFVSEVNATLNALDLASFSIETIKLYYVLKFPDGGAVKVFPNLISEGYDVMSDTARDADNNTIPLTKQEAIGSRFIFSSPNRQRLFNNYVGGWSFRVAEVVKSCASVATICSDEGGDIVCRTRCL